MEVWYLTLLGTFEKAFQIVRRKRSQISWRSSQLHINVSWYAIHVCRCKTWFDRSNRGNNARAKEAHGGNFKFRQEFEDVIEECVEKTAKTLQHKTFWRRRLGEQKGENYPLENPTQVQEGEWNLVVQERWSWVTHLFYWRRKKRNSSKEEKKGNYPPKTKWQDSEDSQNWDSTGQNEGEKKTDWFSDKQERRGDPTTPVWHGCLWTGPLIV